MKTSKKFNKKLKKKKKTLKKGGNMNKINRKTRRKKISDTFKGGNIIMFTIFSDDDNTHNPDSDRCMCVNYDIDDNNNMNINYNPDGRRCKNKVVRGSDFCSKHQNCKGFLKQFTSGYEKKYNPKEWGHPYIEGTHNCYSYFLDDKIPVLMKKCKNICQKEGNNCPQKLKKCRNLIPQPGDHHMLMTKGSLANKKFNYTCDEMNKKILNDNSNIVPSNFFEKCNINHYKGAMVVDPHNTFHFYRQNQDGTWSHKPGTAPVTNIDIDGKIIHIPHFANRDYSKTQKKRPIKYSDFCGYYCVPTNEYEDTHAI